jgi:hypothetical protein
MGETGVENLLAEALDLLEAEPAGPVRPSRWPRPESKPRRQ